jgi:hypothetical protein
MNSFLAFFFSTLFIVTTCAQSEQPSWELIQLEHSGPEDFVYDSIYNRLIIPSGKRGSDSAYGVFQTLDLNDHSVKTLKQPAVLNSWISLGIKAAPFDTSFQYMVNASKSDEDITRILGLSFNEDSVAIIERSLVKNDLPASINNMRWVEGKGLYITNLYKAKTMTRGFISNLKGEVYRAGALGKEAKVILNAQGPNSLGMIDSTLYLTGSRERFLLRITENDHAEKVKTIPLVGGDNVTIDGDKFYTTGSPKVFEVVKYMSEKRETVGSFIYELISENGTLRCNRIILIHPSTNMGMVSVVSKHNGSFYCGQVRGSTILRFTDDPSVVQEILHPKKDKYTKKIYKRYQRLHRKSGVKMPVFCVIRPDILL